MRTVKTRAKAASSLEPIWPTNAWLITWMPKVEALVNMAGAATIHISLLSSHTLLTSDNPSSSSSSSSSGEVFLSSFCFRSPSIFFLLFFFFPLWVFSVCVVCVLEKGSVSGRKIGRTAGLGLVISFELSGTNQSVEKQRTVTQLRSFHVPYGNKQIWLWLWQLREWIGMAVLAPCHFVMSRLGKFILKLNQKTCR